MGLRYTSNQIKEMLKGAREMRESVTYQAILEEGREIGREIGREEGREIGVRKTLLLLGGKRLGEPSESTLAKIQAITDLTQLEQLALRLLEVESWSELLAEG